MGDGRDNKQARVEYIEVPKDEAPCVTTNEPKVAFEAPPGLKWFAEDFDTETGDGRPLRPDLPWLRNLRWVKLHSMQLGVAMGITVYWGQTLGLSGIAFGLSIVAAELILGEWQEQTERSKVSHDVGAHDVREKPWYFVSSALVTWAAFAVILGVPG